MRRRWHVGEGCGLLLMGTWVFGWIPVFILLAALTTPCDAAGCGMNSDAGGWTPAVIFLAVWFGVVVIPVAVVGLVGLVCFAWSERPRRVTEPVTEDLRERT